MSFEATNIATQNTSAPAGAVQANAAQNDVLPKSEKKPPLNHLFIQPKLTVGAPDDPYEKEADAVADKVMRMPEPAFVEHTTAGSEPQILQRNSEEEETLQLKGAETDNFIQKKCADCEKEEEKIHRKPLCEGITPLLQRKSEPNGEVNNSVAHSIESSKGGGSTLDRNTQSFMSSRFGNDFSRVKIHTDSQAVQLNQELNAKAFTVGRDVYFNQGQYQPNSSEGKQLLAHELTHTLQQNRKPLTFRLQKQHDPGGPYHPPEGTSLRCTITDTCSQLSLKINYLRHTILRHQQWDAANPLPDYPNGRHAPEIIELQNALANCIAHTVRCRNQPIIVPAPDTEPVRDRGAARRIGTAAAIGAGAGLVIGGLVGGLGGGVGGTLVLPGVGTIGGGVAGGAAGAAYGAGLGGVVGGAIGGGLQGLIELLD